MKARFKLILSAFFALIIASMVLFAVCSQYAPMNLNIPAHTRIEGSAGSPASNSMSDSAHKRVTMLRGFAYTLGRRCRTWRRLAKKPANLF